MRTSILTYIVCFVFILAFGGVPLHMLSAKGAEQTADDKPDPSRIATLIESLKVPDFHDKSKIDAAEKARVDAAAKAQVELAKIGEPAVEPLIAALKDPDKKVQNSAAFILGEIGDRKAVVPLIAAIQDAPDSLFPGAICSLGRLKDPRAVEALVGILSHYQADVKTRPSRIHAAIALGEIGDPRAVETLLLLVKNGDLDEQISAIIALGKIRDQRAVETLSSVLDSTPPPTKKTHAANKIYVLRRVCVWALGELRNAQAISSLMRALREQEFYWVFDTSQPRLVSADSYTRFFTLGIGLGWEGTMAEVTGVPGDGPAWALGKIGEPAVEPLLNALNDKKAFVREACVFGLGYTGSSNAVESLITLTADKDENIRWLAAEALSRIADARATQYLMEALKKPNWEVITAAHLFFIRCGVEGSEPTLIKALNKRGTPMVALNFLNSGNAQLKTAAEAWARSHGYRTSTATINGQTTKWGEARQ